MAKLKLRGKDLRSIGYPEGPVISIAMNIMEKIISFQNRAAKLPIAVAGALMPDAHAGYG